MTKLEEARIEREINKSMSELTKEFTGFNTYKEYLLSLPSDQIVVSKKDIGLITNIGKYIYQMRIPSPFPVERGYRYCEINKTVYDYALRIKGAEK